MKLRTKKRQALTDSDRSDLAARYRKFYLSAWEDKERRQIPERFSVYEAYWEGDVNMAQSENDPASNTNIVHANVEGQVSLLLEQSIGITPIPVSPSDVPFADSVQNVLEFVKDKNKLLRKLDVHERRREKYGTGILRVSFDPDLLGGAGLPVIETCNPLHVFVDPGITDVYKLQDAEYIIEVFNKSIFWARQQYGDAVADAIEPGYRPQYDDIYHEAAKDDKTYLHMLVWTREDGKLRLVEMTGCGIILSDSFENGHEDFYPGGKYPYFFTPLYYREGSIWGKGDVELLMPVQDLINDIDDQIRINARLTGNPQRLIEMSSGIDLERLTNEAGLNIPTTNINAVRNLEAPPLPAYITQRRDTAMRYEGQKVTRFSDQMSGTKQQGVDSAAEALALQQAGQTVIQHKKLLLQETLADVFSYCLALIREYWTEEVAVRVTERDNDFIFFRGSSLKNVPVAEGSDAVKDAAFDLVVTVGAGMPSNKTAVYQMMSGLFDKGLVSAGELRGFLVDYMGLPLSAEFTPPQAGGTPAVENAAVAGMTQGGHVRRERSDEHAGVSAARGGETT